MAIEKLKDTTEIIFVTGRNLHKTPEPVQDAMASKEARGPIPIVAVFDPKVETLLGVVPYFHMKDVEGFAKVETALDSMRGASAEPSSLTRREPETWTNTRGRTIEATYVTSSEEDVTLRLTSGKTSTVPLAGLSEESQKRVAELAGE